MADVQRAPRKPTFDGKASLENAIEYKDDVEFLEWIHDRFHYECGESNNMGWMLHLYNLIMRMYWQCHNTTDQQVLVSEQGSELILEIPRSNQTTYKIQLRLKKGQVVTATQDSLVVESV